MADVLNRFNTRSIPYITVEELAMPKTNAILLDARENKEFQVSHLKNAIPVGFDDFNLKETLQNLPDKKATIVVYCTLGVRSEIIGEQLKQQGFINVLNLYGGIIEWKNKNFTVFDKDENETENIHVGNAYWSQWLLKGEKIYD